jgi:cell division control protein 6
MKHSNLTTYFEKYITKDSLFLNKEALQSSYLPDTLLHRDEEINQIASILAPCLKLEKPSNIFIYGKTGTGKTACIQYITSQIKSLAQSKNIPLRIFYVNCKLRKVADTEYRLMAHLSRELGKEIPPTGLPTEEIYKLFFNTIDNQKQQVIIVLDELDQIVKKTGDELLYNMTRINSELKNAQLSIIGISNDITFTDNLDPRIKSSLSEEEILFPPYNALQLQNILRKRAQVAFKRGCLARGVIEKCAAYAARGHGDARRALELLRVAGEIAERGNKPAVAIKHLDEAQEKIERDKVTDIILTQPKQYHLVLYSLLQMKNKKGISTGDVYEAYTKLCSLTSQRPLTTRRISDIIAELDMFGIVNARVVSKGRYGRTKEITLSIPPSLSANIEKSLKESLGLE